MTLEQLHEQTLVMRSQMADEAAFTELFALYGARMLGFVQRLSADSPERAADLVQEIWITIYRQLPKLREPARFRPWAFQIARWKVYGGFRLRELTTVPIDEAIEGVPDENLSTGDLRNQLDAQMEHLSREHREVLLLRYFEEMSYQDIAGVAGVTVGTVRSRLHNAKQSLRNHWIGPVYE